MHRPLPCKYSRATRDYVVNLKIALDTQLSQLGDPRVAVLRDELEGFAQRVFEIDNELQAACDEVRKHPDFEDMRAGRKPYPMEPLAAFKPRCDCDVVCNACSDKAPQYMDPAGDAVGPIRHTCVEPCPVHGFDRQ
jgi:hypothetical protein